MYVRIQYAGQVKWPCVVFSVFFVSFLALSQPNTNEYPPIEGNVSAKIRVQNVTSKSWVQNLSAQNVSWSKCECPKMCCVRNVWWVRKHWVQKCALVKMWVSECWVSTKSGVQRCGERAYQIIAKISSCLLSKLGKLVAQKPCLPLDDVIKWKHFPRYWPCVRGIQRSPVNSPHKGQWRGAFVFSLICALNKRLSKQSWCWWLETPSRSLWRHCYENKAYAATDAPILEWMSDCANAQLFCLLLVIFKYKKDE